MSTIIPERLEAAVAALGAHGRLSTRCGRGPAQHRAADAAALRAAPLSVRLPRPPRQPSGQEDDLADLPACAEQVIGGGHVVQRERRGDRDPDRPAWTSGRTCFSTCRASTAFSSSGRLRSVEALIWPRLWLSPQAIRALGGGASQFLINTGNPIVYVGGADVGAFAGDDWKLKPNLTLSLGVRYETQENIRDRSDVAPRLAVAWAPGGSAKNTNPRTVIRAGFGMFYDRFSEQNVLIAQRYDGANQQQFIITNPDTYPAIPSLTSLQSIPQTIHTISSSLRAPYLIQSSISVERQLPQKSTLALTYTKSHGLHELLSRNINAPLPGTYAGIPGSGVYPYPNQGPIYEMESAGLYNQNQLALNLNSRPNAKISLFASYSLNYARSNTDGLNTFPANQYSMAGEYSPAANDVRHRASMGGSITTKFKLQWNPFIILQSGAPFNIVTSQDIYGDTLLTARPAFATNPNQPGVISTPYGLLDPNPSPGEPIVPRNYGRGPGLVTINLRLARTFRFGETRAGKTDRPYGLTLSISARNLVNHVNPGPIIGNINSPLFGESNQIASGSGAYADGANNRRLEFQARFAF